MAETEKSDEDITTIQIKVGTRKRLGKVGSKSDTYDSILNKLMDLAEGIKKRVK